MTYQGLSLRGVELTLATRGRFTKSYELLLNQSILGELVKEPGGRRSSAFFTIAGTRFHVRGEGTVLHRLIYVEEGGNEVLRLQMRSKKGYMITSAGHRFTIVRRLLPPVTVVKHETTGTEICRLYRHGLRRDRKIILNSCGIDSSELSAVLAALCFETLRREPH